MPPIRIAVALSGGVDSAVTALLLHRCVHAAADVAALRCFGSAVAPPPALSALIAAIEARRPLHSLLPRGVVVPPSACGSCAGVSLYSFYLRNWHDASLPHGWCARSQRDYEDAQRMAHTLDLLPRTAALPVLDFSAEYATECFQHMLHAYAKGHTLNVDVLCNSRIKFGVVAQSLGVVQASSDTADPQTLPLQQQQTTLLATGHYARTWCLPQAGATLTRPPPALLLQPCSAGRDLNDQTHFLARVSPRRLAGALFPLGHLFTCKRDVRDVARRCLGDDMAAKRTSTGICFVGPPRSTDAGNSGRPLATTTAASAAAASPSLQSCNARFAHFLNEFVPPPRQRPLSLPLVPSHTIFRDATTGAEKTLALHDGALSGLRADFPRHLPAYALTLGQKIRLVDADHRSGSGGRRRSAVVSPYYVARKTYLRPDPCEDEGVARLLAEVLVVRRWDDPLLYKRRVHAVSVRWWLPIAVLRGATHSDGDRSGGGSARTLECLCAVRHQATPLPAVVKWETAAEEREEGDEERRDGDVLRVRCCTVLFHSPVRAVAAGQAVVMYAPLSDVLKRVAGEAARQQLQSQLQPAGATSALALIGTAWVAASEDAVDGCRSSQIQCSRDRLVGGA